MATSVYDFSDSYVPNSTQSTTRIKVLNRLKLF
jgi:hypothetical protein